MIAACGRSPRGGDAVPVVEHETPAPVEDATPMVTIQSKADVAGKDDQIVDVVGVYAIQDLGRHRIVSKLADGSELQSNKLSYLKLDDGSTVRLGARPDTEHAMKDQRVRATGRLKELWPPPEPAHVAQPNAKPTLLEITSVAPAP